MRSRYRIDDDGRECSRCRKYKPWAEFSPNPRAKTTGHQSACKTCRNAAQVRAASANRDAWRAKKFTQADQRRRAAGWIPADERRAQRWKITPEGRICCSCEAWKPWDEFYVRPDNPGKRLSRCKACYKSLADELRYTRYGITKKDYDWLRAQQRGVCALCQCPETRQSAKGTTWSLAVEHDHSCPDHSTWEGCKRCIRGLTCDRCNRLIGKVEQIGGLVTARFADYLTARPFIITVDPAALAAQLVSHGSPRAQ